MAPACAILSPRQVRLRWWRNRRSRTLPVHSSLCGASHAQPSACLPPPPTRERNGDTCRDRGPTARLGLCGQYGVREPSPFTAQVALLFLIVCSPHAGFMHSGHLAPIMRCIGSWPLLTFFFVVFKRACGFECRSTEKEKLRFRSFRRLFVNLPFLEVHVSRAKSTRSQQSDGKYESDAIQRTQKGRLFRTAESRGRPSTSSSSFMLVLLSRIKVGSCRGDGGLGIEESLVDRPRTCSHEVELLLVRLQHILQ